MEDLPVTEEELKAIKDGQKEALKQFLDDKFAAFGRWSAAGLATALLVALTYFLLQLNGWTHK